MRVVPCSSLRALLLVVALCLGTPGMAETAKSVTPPLSVRIDPVLQGRVQALAGGSPGATALLLDLRTRTFVSLVRADMALCSRVAPGSLAKLVTAVALLDHGLASGRERVTCRNEVRLWGRCFTCGLPGGHGPVDMRTALARSCSVWFYSVGQRVERAHLEAACSALGLEGKERPSAGAWLGRLRPGPTRRALTLALGGEGPGVTLAPWQVAVMMERIAGVHTWSGGPSARARRFLQAALAGAVAWGTATPAALAHIAVAGKTGTADVRVGPTSGEGAARVTHGWFAGYAPAEAPRVAVVVFLYRGDGQAAARLGGRILQVALERRRP